MFKRMPNESQGESFKNLPLVSPGLLVKVMLAAVKGKPGGFNDFILRQFLVGWSPGGGQVVLCSPPPLRDSGYQKHSHFNILFPGSSWTSTSTWQVGRGEQGGPSGLAHFPLATCSCKKPGKNDLNGPSESHRVGKWNSLAITGKIFWREAFPSVAGDEVCSKVTLYYLGMRPTCVLYIQISPLPLLHHSPTRSLMNSLRKHVSLFPSAYGQIFQFQKRGCSPAENYCLPVWGGREEGNEHLLSAFSCWHW